ncbi:MAG: hypothetical protein RDV41_10325, partial [Planctomycetota bacterium]|nr:hypothetical protein [Planctomycetota bacterium]
GAALVWVRTKMSPETQAATYWPGVILFVFLEFVFMLLVLEFYPFLGGDMWFEESLINKLKALGKLKFDPAAPGVSLIGITHPRSVRWWKLDHDDDVGFLRMTENEFQYVGEAEDLTIQLSVVTGISEMPYPFFSVMGLKWVIVDYKEGVEAKRVFICARDKVSIRKAVHETRDIAVRLMALCEVARKTAQAIPAPAPAPLSPPAVPPQPAANPPA